MVNKKLSIAIILSTIVLLLSVMIPTMLYASDGDSPTVTRLYSDSLEGPWTNTASATTRYIEEITVIDGLATIVIQEADFMC